MNKTEKYLLDAAINLAVTNEFENFTEMNEESIEFPMVLDKRVHGILRKWRFTQFCKNNFRTVAAACFFLAVVGVGVPLYAEAKETNCYMWTEQDRNREFISVKFLFEEDEISVGKTLKPHSASDVLENCELVRAYSTESVYIEEYDGIWYEQTTLHSEGRYVLSTKDKTVRNIRMNDYMAVLVFDASEAAIVWRDDKYSYLLKGAISSDDAMRYVRLICE